MRRFTPILLSVFAGFVIGGSQSSATTASEPNSASPEQIPVPPGCGIQNAFGWTAKINAMPPGSPRLAVSGSVLVPTGGYKAELVRKGIDINPRIVTLHLVVTPPSPGTQVTQGPSVVKAEGSVPDVVRNMEKVNINCAGSKLAEITKITVLD